MDPARWVNVLASGLMAVSAVGFMVVYHLLAPWRRSVEGRHMMALAGALALLGTYTVVIAVWPESSLLRLVRAGLVTALAVLLLRQTVMVVRAQRH